MDRVDLPTIAAKYDVSMQRINMPVFGDYLLCPADPTRWYLRIDVGVSAVYVVGPEGMVTANNGIQLADPVDFYELKFPDAPGLIGLAWRCVTPGTAFLTVTTCSYRG